MDHCKFCGAVLEQSPTGRPREFCSDSHRAAFWRRSRDPLAEKVDALLGPPKPSRFDALAAAAAVSKVAAFLRGASAEKAALVADATGRVLLPPQLVVDALAVARARGVFRRLVEPVPTRRERVEPGLLTEPTLSWGRREVAAASTDANVSVDTGAPDIVVHDLAGLAKVGKNLLDDTRGEEFRRAFTVGLGTVVARMEDAAFAGGDGVDRPRGIGHADNVARVPSGQKVAVATSNTPTTAQLVTVPSLLPAEYHDDAVWLMHPTSHAQIAALEYTSGAPVMPNHRELFGWPVHVLPGLPDPATAGTDQASVMFGAVGAAYEIAARDEIRLRVLREAFAEQGLVGFVVDHRVGGDVVRPQALAVYTQ